MFQSGGSSQEKHRSSSLQPVNPGKLFSTFSFTCPWDLCISRLFFWKIVCTLFVESKTLYKKPFEELKKPRRSFLDSNHKSVKYVFSPIFTSIDVVGKCPPPRHVKICSFLCSRRPVLIDLSTASVSTNPQPLSLKWGRFWPVPLSQVLT